ncbi:hypothetical protein FA13DRAFT_1710105 [Coprinellus micaceus]|uniref:Uncharacterized protein n=1 Tax=Coprinellus micaceus TaxID=71717 RepID=A0A4Y7T9J3_COPMI|nr:hypothetical protein FA13DRAFT_1710105 [Coprinellus micaceus]
MPPPSSLVLYAAAAAVFAFLVQVVDHPLGGGGEASVWVIELTVNLLNELLPCAVPPSRLSPFGVTACPHHLLHLPSMDIEGEGGCVDVEGGFGGGVVKRWVGDGWRSLEGRRDVVVDSVGAGAGDRRPLDTDGDGGQLGVAWVDVRLKRWRWRRFSTGKVEETEGATLASGGFYATGTQSVCESPSAWLRRTSSGWVIRGVDGLEMGDTCSFWADNGIWTCLRPSLPPTARHLRSSIHVVRRYFELSFVGADGAFLSCLGPWEMGCGFLEERDTIGEAGKFSGCCEGADTREGDWVGLTPKARNFDTSIRHAEDINQSNKLRRALGWVWAAIWGEKRW